jgi:hypothetical protein
MKFNFQKGGTQRVRLKCPLFAPRVVWTLAGAAIIVPPVTPEISWLDTKEVYQMKKSALFLVFGLVFYGIAMSTSLATADDKDRRDNITVSFGLWDPNKDDLKGAPLDRLLGDPLMGVGVNDIIIPNEVTIKEGDAVNFIIGGGHVVTVYDDGTKPEDIRTSPSFIEPAANCPTTAGGVINDPQNRIYRGPCFSTNFGTTPSTTITRRDGVE